MFWICSAIVQLLLICIVVTNCTYTVNSEAQLQRRFANYLDLKPHLLDKAPNISQFMAEGPFKYTQKRNYAIRVSPTENINTDVFFSHHPDKSPLVIIQHGNLAHKGVHENQARHLASWGFHCLVLSLPNSGQWIQNGYTLSKLVELLHAWPELLDDRFDAQKIIVAGHSFGGSAAVIAAGKNAPVTGVILLDPAMVSRKVRHYLRKVEVPVVLLGADQSKFKSRRRKDFFRYVQDDMIEVSIRNATHNDAQSPNLFSLDQVLGLDYATSAARQETFMATLTASVFSIAATGGYAYVWSALQPEIQRGTIIAPKRK